ncbi:hypothetical protein Droror1_Dr00027073 [Drosera rotundifolia]
MSNLSFDRVDRRTKLLLLLSPCRQPPWLLLPATSAAPLFSSHQHRSSLLLLRPLHPLPLPATTASSFTNAATPPFSGQGARQAWERRAIGYPPSSGTEALAGKRSGALGPGSGEELLSGAPLLTLGLGIFSPPVGSTCQGVQGRACIPPSYVGHPSSWAKGWVACLLGPTSRGANQQAGEKDRLGSRPSPGRAHQAGQLTCRGESFTEQRIWGIPYGSISLVVVVCSTFVGLSSEAGSAATDSSTAGSSALDASVGSPDELLDHGLLFKASCIAFSSAAPVVVVVVAQTSDAKEGYHALTPSNSVPAVEMGMSAIVDDSTSVPVDSAQKDGNWTSWTDQVDDKSESYADVLKGTVGSKMDVAVMTGNQNMRNGIQLSNKERRDEEVRISLGDVNASFKFLNLWNKHPSFMNLVEEEWKCTVIGDRMFRIILELKSLKQIFRIFIGNISLRFLNVKIMLRRNCLTERGLY